MGEGGQGVQSLAHSTWNVWRASYGKQLCVVITTVKSHKLTPNTCRCIPVMDG